MQQLTTTFGTSPSLRDLSSIVKQAKSFSSSITLQATNGQEFDAKSLFKMQKGNFKLGDVIEITVEGEDEIAAAQDMARYIAQHE